MGSRVDTRSFVLHEGYATTLISKTCFRPKLPLGLKCYASKSVALVQAGRKLTSKGQSTGSGRHGKVEDVGTCH